MSFEWIASPQDEFAAMVDAYVRAIQAGAYAVCKKRQPEIENWMKENAPWTDRTGNARQALNVDVTQELANIIIQLQHGVEYGFWLEVKNQGKWGILAPAIDHWVPILLADLQRMLA